MPSEQWIDAAKHKPTHIYTVVVWVTGGPLHCNEDYLDVGIWNEARGTWQTYGDDNGNDIDVEVSHWFSPDAPAAQPPVVPTPETASCSCGHTYAQYRQRGRFPAECLECECSFWNSK